MLHWLHELMSNSSNSGIGRDSYSYWSNNWWLRHWRPMQWAALFVNLLLNFSLTLMLSWSRLRHSYTNVLLIYFGSAFHSLLEFWIAKILFLLCRLVDVTSKNLVLMSPSLRSWDLALWCQKTSSAVSNSFRFLDNSCSFCSRSWLGGPCWILAISSFPSLILLAKFPKCSQCHLLDSDLNSSTLFRKLGLAQLV